MIDIIEKTTMRIPPRQGWLIVGFRNAKTHEHIKYEMSKTHGLATLRPYQYYVVKPLKNKEKLYYLKIFKIPFFAKNN